MIGIPIILEIILKSVFQLDFLNKTFISVIG
jgi:hypothetical protein